MMKHNITLHLHRKKMRLRKILTAQGALLQMKRYCSFQERSHREVRSKLLELGQRGIELENVMTILIEEGFLNEERFAKAYAGGKFRMKGWGRKKIEQELMREGVSDYCINKALSEINESDYKRTLRSLLEKKAPTVYGDNIFIRKQKLSNYLIGKGFETELVWREVNNFIRE